MELLLANIEPTSDLQIQLGGLLKALGKQIDALAKHAASQADFDKKTIDDIYATSRALTKVRELAEIADGALGQDVNDAEVVRDILNLIEERIDELAQQRADAIVANHHNEPSTGKARQCSAAQAEGISKTAAGQ